MEFETLKQIEEYEAANVLTDEQRRVLFERRMQIFLRIHQWREENERLGLAPDLTDTWTPEQREQFLRDWQDDEVLNHGEKRTHEEMSDEPSTSQTGRGDDHERPFYVESVRQVYTKKFKTNATSYRVHFTNVFADVEITSLHEQLHDIFQQVMDETVGDVPPQDQVHFLLHSNQLDKPIHFPFMSAERLTTEHILAKFEQVIQSNQEFRLNDTMEINVIHVSMPIGGKRSKRTKVNLEKHLEKKICVWRELSWLPEPNSMTTLATGRYETTGDRCKRVWHRNFTKMPTCLSVRARSSKPNCSKRT